MLCQAALDKVDQIQSALARFCPDEAQRATFQQVVKAGCCSPATGHVGVCLRNIVARFLLRMVRRPNPGLEGLQR